MLKNKNSRRLVQGKIVVLSLVILGSVFSSRPTVPQQEQARKPASAPRDLRKLQPKVEAVRADLDLILKEAKLENAIAFTRTESQVNFAEIKCAKDKITVEVHGTEAWGQTFYMALQRMGFLFPHPRKQISPTLAQVREHCGRTYNWNPAVKYSGFTE